MGKPLSEDLRERLIRSVESGMSARAAGRKLYIAPSTATGIVQQWRERGDYAALQVGGHRRSVLEKEAAFIEEMVSRHGDWSEEEMQAHLEAERGLRVHPTTIGRFIRGQGWRYKKNGIRDRA